MARRRWEYTAEGDVSPERFIRALTDFSKNRPRYWPGQTSNLYRVLKKGKTWALVREGTGIAWEQSRYDWSKPGLVVSTVEDSNFLNPGTTWEFRVKKRKGGGCRVEVVLERDFKGPQGVVASMLSYLPGTGTGFALVLRRTLAILEDEEADRAQKP